VQLDLARLIEDGHRRLVFLRLPDIVRVNEVAKYLHGVGAAEADGRTRETDSARVGKRFSEIPGKSSKESVLRAVRLVSDDDDVRAV